MENLDKYVQIKGFRSVGKALIKDVGTYPALLLTCYMEHHIWSNGNTPDYQGWFAYPYEKLMADFGLSMFIIRKSKKTLLNKKAVIRKTLQKPGAELLKINLNYLFNIGRPQQIPQKPTPLERVRVRDINFLKKRDYIFFLILNQRFNNKENNNPQKKIFLNEISNDWLDICIMWLEYKRERKQLYKSPKSFLIWFKYLEKISLQNIKTAQTIVERSIANNWAGVFPLNSNNTNKSNKVGKITLPSKKYKDDGYI